MCFLRERDEVRKQHDEANPSRQQPTSFRNQILNQQTGGSHMSLSENQDDVAEEEPRSSRPSVRPCTRIEKTTTA
jgi:hypothetical protein